MADITYYISASYIGEGLENSNFLLYHTQCNNPSYLIEYGGSQIISSASLASGLTLTLDESISTLYLYPVSEDCPLGCGYNYTLTLSVPPSPTPTVSISPSISATPGVSPTPSTSFVPEPSPDPSPPNSPPLSPGASAPATPTPTASPSDTPSVSVTPSISVTPENSPTPSISKTPPPTPSISLTPSTSIPSLPCTYYFISVTSSSPPNSSVIFTWTNCSGQLESTTLYPGYVDLVCVQEGSGGVEIVKIPGDGGALPDASASNQQESCTS